MWCEPRRRWDADGCESGFRRKCFGSQNIVDPWLQACIESLLRSLAVECAVGKPCSLALQALKQVKGVLNKLTPEKFERLLEQLLDAVKSVEVLRGLIALIFENAVAQVQHWHTWETQGLGVSSPSFTELRRSWRWLIGIKVQAEERGSFPSRPSTTSGGDIAT